MQRIQLTIEFIDFQKVFDKVTFGQYLTADSRYTTLLEEIYKSPTMDVKIDETAFTRKIPLQRDIRQGDNICPKLLTLEKLVLEICEEFPVTFFGHLKDVFPYI